MGASFLRLSIICLCATITSFFLFLLQPKIGRKSLDGYKKETYCIASAQILIIVKIRTKPGLPVVLGAEFGKALSRTRHKSISTIPLTPFQGCARRSTWAQYCGIHQVLSIKEHLTMTRVKEHLRSPVSNHGWSCTTLAGVTKAQRGQSTVVAPAECLEVMTLNLAFVPSTGTSALFLRILPNSFIADLDLPPPPQFKHRCLLRPLRA